LKGSIIKRVLRRGSITTVSGAVTPEAIAGVRGSEEDIKGHHTLSCALKKYKKFHDANNAAQ
jgi:hypothetical protein